MTDSNIKPLRLYTLGVAQGTHLALPARLRATTRAGTGEVDPLLAGIVVDRVYALGMPRRGGPPVRAERFEPGQPELLALETEDGYTLFIRSDTLAEAIERAARGGGQWRGGSQPFARPECRRPRSG